MKFNPKISLGLIFLIGFLIIIPTTFAQESVDHLDQGIQLAINLAPSIVEPGQTLHSAGFVSLENTDNEGVPASQDFRIELKSSDPEIVFVDPFVVIHKDDQYAKFDLQVGNKEGIVDITASIGENEVSMPFQVGGVIIDIVEKVNLKINFPKEEMHSNTEMPISVVLVDVEDNVLQAPDDMIITLEYSKSLLSVKDETLIIPKGDFFAETILTSSNEIGTGFIKANNKQLGINVLSQISITSTAPAELQMNIFPEKVAYTEDRFSIFVSLLDSAGQPTKATKDIKFELFTDDLLISRTFDEDIPSFGPLSPQIKKGEYSWFTTIEFQFQESQKTAIAANVGADEEDEEIEGIVIGASSPDLGIASDLLEVVDPLILSNLAAEDQLVTIFTVTPIPRGIESVLVYQLTNETPDPDDEDVDVIGPVQSTINFSPIGSSIAATQRFSVISDNTEILSISNTGPITSGDSYGHAKILSKKALGTATIATTFEGVGTATTDIEVVDTVAASDTVIFTASGGDKILFDNNGEAELYVMVTDSAGRPTKTIEDIELIIAPENELIVLESFSSFIKTKINHNNLPELVNNRTNISITPVGIKADDALAVITSFEVQSRPTIVKITPGLTSLTTDGSTKREKIGVVQIMDPFGNPIPQNKDLQVLFTFGTPVLDEGGEFVVSEQISENEILRPPLSVIIPKGKSYTDFYITLFGKPGSEIISATAEGIQAGSSAEFTVNEFFKQLLLYIPPPAPLEVGEAVTMDLFVDDEYGDSIADVDIKIDGKNVTVTPPITTTNEFGGFSITIMPTAPEASFSIAISKFGYEGETKTVTLDVAAGEVEQTTLFGVDPIILYAAVGIMIAAVAGMAVKFLRKPPEAPDEEEEEL